MGLSGIIIWVLVFLFFRERRYFNKIKFVKFGRGGISVLLLYLLERFGRIEFLGDGLLEEF